MGRTFVTTRSTTPSGSSRYPAKRDCTKSNPGRRMLTEGTNDSTTAGGGRRVVVTGGSGFIGTHLVGALKAQGAQVANLDIRRPNLREHDPLWRPCDVRDADAIRAALRDIRPVSIFNLAATTDISGATDLDTNTAGVRNLIDAFPDDPNAHLIHVSSQLVIGPGHTPTGLLDFHPYSPYGVSKAESEKIVHGSSQRVAWTVVRPTNVWGPLHPTFADQIWKYLAAGWYMHPTGNDPQRSYGYVANVVQQLMRVATLPRSVVDRQTFYVGDEPIPSSRWLDAFSVALRGKPARRVPLSILRLAAELGDASAKIGGPSPINRGRLYRMTTDYAVPMDHTFEVLGRGPIQLDEGVERTVAWLRERTRR